MRYEYEMINCEIERNRTSALNGGVTIVRPTRCTANA
jgi:hypothetical protein